jgi:hypothetical protein
MLFTPTEDRNVPSQFFQAPSLFRVYCFRATTSSQTEPNLVIVSVRSPHLLRGVAIEYSVTVWRTPIGEWMEILYRLTYRREWMPERNYWRDIVVRQERCEEC